MKRATGWLLGACIAAGLACASSPAPEAIVARGLVPAGQLPGDLRVEHRLAFHFGKRGGALEAVLQVYCGEVMVMGLGPMRQPLFWIRQRGDDIEAWSQRPWPLPPARILLDVHRIFLYPVADPPLVDGVHSREVATVAFEERWEQGQLVERVIPGGGEHGVRIRFHRGDNPRAGSAPATLVDERLGYRLEVEPHRYRRGTCEEDELALRGVEGPGSRAPRQVRGLVAKTRT